MMTKYKHVNSQTVDDIWDREIVCAYFLTVYKMSTLILRNIKYEVWYVLFDFCNLFMHQSHFRAVYAYLINMTQIIKRPHNSVGTVNVIIL